MNRVIDLNKYTDVREELREDLLDRKAGITVINKGKTRKLIIVNKGAYNWLIFDGTTHNYYEDIEELLNIDLERGLNPGIISIAEFTI